MTNIASVHIFLLFSLVLASIDEAVIPISNVATDIGMGPSDQAMDARSLLALDDSSILKDHELMAKRQYDWAAAHKQKDKGVYFSSQHKTHVPDLVAIHPDLLFKDPNLTEHRYSLLLRTATQVAAFTRKSVVWPAIPCSLSWVLGPQAALNATPGQIAKGSDGKTEWIVHVETSLPSSFQGLKETKTTVCSSKRQLTANCLAGGSPSGVTSLEFEHIKERYRLWKPYDPSPEKIILAVGRADLDFRKVLKWEEPVPRVTYHDFIKQVADVNRLPATRTLEDHSKYTMHVLYLGQALEIDCSDPKNQGRPAYDKMFEGHNHQIYSLNLPDKPPSELAKIFDEMQKRCLA